MSHLALEKEYIFVNSVLEAFPHQFDEFVKLAKDLRDNGTEKTIAIAKIAEFIQGNRNLLLDLKEIFPEAEITIPPAESHQPFTRSDALTFARKVKARFEGGEVFKTFVHIMKMFSDDEKSVKEVHDEVISLFSNHQDLIEEFRTILPKS